MKIAILWGYMIVIGEPLIGITISSVLNILTFPYDYLLNIRFLYPTSGLYESLVGILIKCQKFSSCPGFRDLFEWNAFTRGIVVMILQTILLNLLGLLIENRTQKFILFKPFYWIISKFYSLYYVSNSIDENEDDDVKNERKIVNEITPPNDSLFIRNLSKNYNSTL